MIFNSLDFAVFLPIVFAVYWSFKGSIKFQNLLIVFSSYIFYGWWDPRFLVLILFSTLVDYFVGLQISKSENRTKRKSLLFLSITVNLGLLAFFKYYNFFVDSFNDSFTILGSDFNLSSLEIILPVE